MNPKTIFESLFFAPSEDAVDEIINNHQDIFKQNNWVPIGGDEKLFGIVRGQQSSPIAALVEKVTNSIDALLMKKCFEAGIDPKSSNAPHTMHEAIDKFFPE